MYTTQLQAGLGLPQETRALLEIWQPGMARAALFQAALQSGRFPNVSARRLRNIVVECFAPRYLAPEPQPARYLKQLNGVLSSGEFAQLFFLYTCRANLLLADFVREVYWERYAAGAALVAHGEAMAFVRRGVDDGKTAIRWAASTIERVSSYLTGCCADYGLLGQRTLKGREIVPYRIETRVAAYLAHDLHFAGLGDNGLTADTDWQLFGLGRDDVREELKRLSLKGQFILQSAGDVLHIGWKHKTMEGFLDVLTQG
jgi:hypothetical protein